MPREGSIRCRWERRHRSHRIGDSNGTGDLRTRRCWRLWRRLADQRKGVLAGKVRARRTRDGEHRLQRPILHVVCGRGASRALGIDRGLPFPLEDIPRAEAILLVGGNMAETMPPIMRYFEAQQRQRRDALDCVPIRAGRRRPSGRRCICALRPGSDAALANGLVHLLIKDGHVDTDYIREPHGRV